MRTTRTLGSPPARPPAVRIPTFTPEQRQRIGAAIDALLKSIRATMRAAAAAFAKATRQVGHFADTAHRRRRDRPAWVTPYGPAPRLHGGRR